MIVKRENKYKGHLSIDELVVKTRSGTEVKREVLSKKNAVAGLVFNTETKKYILVSQWRPGSSSTLVEIVAGTLDVPGEDPRDAMAREIEEEIGYKLDSIKLIDECYMSPGGSSEIITIYYCEVSNKVSNGGGLEYEDIDVVEMTKEDIFSTRFKDAKTIIAINWLKNKFINDKI